MSEMIRFIDEYRNRFSVELICRTLKDNRAGGFITSRGYRQSKARGLSARRLRDAVLVERISAVHWDNYGVYGVRKMRHVLRRDGIDIGREQTARLLPLQALNQEIVCAERTTGLIAHSDHGSQYVSVVYNERLAPSRDCLFHRNCWGFL